MRYRLPAAADLSTIASPRVGPARSRGCLRRWHPGDHRRGRPWSRAVLVAPAGDPGAAGGAPPISEVEPLLDDAPIRFGLNRQAQARAARCQSSLADGARHADAFADFAYFLSIIRDRIAPDVGGQPSRGPLKNLGFLTSAEVRRRPDYKLSRRKQGFESPRERQSNQVLVSNRPAVPRSFSNFSPNQ